MPSLIEFRGDWTADEQVLIEHAARDAEDVGLPPLPDDRQTPWVALRGVLKDKHVYAASRASVDNALLGRTANGLATRIQHFAQDQSADPAEASDRPYYQLAYVSSASDNLTDEDLREILRKARTNNADLDVTGLLLHANGRFLQVLEGPKEAVRSLYTTIKKDPRHSEVETLLETSVAERTFPEWRMALENLTFVAREEGASPFLLTGDLSTSSLPSERLVEVLEQFQRAAREA